MTPEYIDGDKLHVCRFSAPSQDIDMYDLLPGDLAVVTDGTMVGHVLIGFNSSGYYVDLMTGEYSSGTNYKVRKIRRLPRGSAVTLVVK